MGWDGVEDGPLGILPKLGASVVAEFDDPDPDVDTLGNDAAVGKLLARAYRDAVHHGGSRSDMGQGQDT
jgi:hypothetical protein